MTYWWFMPVITAVGSLRQEKKYLHFKSILVDTVSSKPLWAVSGTLSQKHDKFILKNMNFIAYDI